MYVSQFQELCKRMMRPFEQHFVHKSALVAVCNRTPCPSGNLGENCKKNNAVVKLTVFGHFFSPSRVWVGWVGLVVCLWSPREVTAASKTLCAPRRYGWRAHSNPYHARFCSTFKKIRHFSMKDTRSCSLNETHFAWVPRAVPSIVRDS